MCLLITILIYNYLSSPKDVTFKDIPSDKQIFNFYFIDKIKNLDTNKA